MIDGGKGQYSVSREVLNELGLHDLPILAIAKGKRRNAGEEKIYYQNKVQLLNIKEKYIYFWIKQKIFTIKLLKNKFTKSIG